MIAITEQQHDNGPVRILDVNKVLADTVVAGTAVVFHLSPLDLFGGGKGNRANTWAKNIAAAILRNRLKWSAEQVAEYMDIKVNTLNHRLRRHKELMETPFYATYYKQVLDRLVPVE